MLEIALMDAMIRPKPKTGDCIKDLEVGRRLWRKSIRRNGRSNRFSFPFSPAHHKQDTVGDVNRGILVFPGMVRRLCRCVY